MTGTGSGSGRQGWSLLDIASAHQLLKSLLQLGINLIGLQEKIDGSKERYHARRCLRSWRLAVYSRADLTEARTRCLRSLS